MSTKDFSKSVGEPAPADAAVTDALEWVDDFIARCNGDDRGSCESVNILRRALATTAGHAAAPQGAILGGANGLVWVTPEDANAYARIIRLLGMEEEGDPAAEVERLLATQPAAPAPAPSAEPVGMHDPSVKAAVEKNTALYRKVMDRRKLADIALQAAWRASGEKDAPKYLPRSTVEAAVWKPHSWVLQAMADAIKHALATQPAAPYVQGEPEGWREFLQDVAGQKPEKPDYWSSCGQCERNIGRAEDLLDAAPLPPQPSVEP